MKAVILAAGKGTRMRELTNELPKPMLKVHGKPILEHIILGLITSGIKEFFIVTGFKAETIENYFQDGCQWDVSISYGRQVVQDGTGKAPELAKEFVGYDTFVLTYGDILVKPETYQQMQTRFRKQEFSALVTATSSQDITKGGLNFFDDQFRLIKLIEKATPAQIDALQQEGWLKPGDIAWYNAGIYIFSPSLFLFTAKLKKSSRGEYELTDALISMLATGHKIAGLAIPGRWVDVRDPEVLAELEREQL
ncbi:MAG: NTP transferase domain-containing protein [Verrucomicrobia bacterium]|nr:NTP transferase domain-containing protein [Verrucomicrobiota bacterium]